MDIGEAKAREPPPVNVIMQELMEDVRYRQDASDSDCILNDLCGVAFLLET